MKLSEIPEEVTQEFGPSDKSQTVVKLSDVDAMSDIQRVTREDFDMASLSYSEEEIAELKKKGPIGLSERWIRESEQSKLPGWGGAYDLTKALTFKNAIDRLRKNEYREGDPQKAKDAALAKETIRYASEVQARGYSTAAQVADGAAYLPTYMLEFAATAFFGSGAGALVARGTAKAAMAAGLKYGMGEATRRLTAGVAGAAARAAVGGTIVGAASLRIPAGFVEQENALNLVPTERGLQLAEQMQSNPVQSFYKAWGGYVTEMFGEQLGGIVISPFFKTLGASKVVKPIMDKVMAAYQKLHPSQTLTQIYKVLATKTGWNGMVSELGEEVLTNILQSELKIQDFGAIDGNMLDRLTSAIPDGEEFMVMLGVLSVPGATHLTAQTGLHAALAVRDMASKARAKGLEAEDLAKDQPADTSILGKGVKPFDVAAKAAEEALQPLPNEELTREELGALRVAQRSGEVEFEESKPVPERGVVKKIKETPEYQQADETLKAELLIKGRTADLDRQIDTISEEVDLLEQDLKRTRGFNEKQQDLTKERSRKVKEQTEALVSKLEAELEAEVRIPDISSTLKSVRQALKDEVSPDVRAVWQDLETALSEELEYRKKTKVSSGTFRATTKVKIAEVTKRAREVTKAAASVSSALEKETNAVVWQKQERLVAMVRQLVALNQQKAYMVAQTAEDMLDEKVSLKGQSLETLRKTARKVGEKLERDRLTRVMRSTKATEQERRVALVKYLQARLPGKENAKMRDKYALRAAKGMTEKALQSMFEDIEGLRETVLVKQLQGVVKGLIAKLQPVFKNGVKHGAFKDVALSRQSEELTRAYSRSKPEAETAIQEAVREISALVAAGDGSSDVAEMARYRALVNFMVGGLEARNATQLEDAIRFLTKELARFMTGRDTVGELRKAQRRALKQAIRAEMEKRIRPDKTLLDKAVKLYTKNVQKVFGGVALPLAGLWEHFSDGSKNSKVLKYVVSPLEKISRNTAALRMVMEQPFRDAMAKFFGKSVRHNDGEYFRFLSSRMSVAKTDDPMLKPFLAEFIDNRGEKIDLRISREEVLYWYALAYESDGVVDPVGMETLTNENQVAAIRTQETTRAAGKAEVEPDILEQIIQTRQKEEVKGNAIPSNILQRMFDTLTPEDKAYAHEVRLIFSSFWPKINAVFSRITGIDMTEVPLYIPRIRERGSRYEEELFEAASLMDSWVSPFPGSVKERMPTASAPFKQIAVSQVMHGFVRSMSHWMASHDVTERVNMLLKDEDIQQAIDKATDGEAIRGGKWRQGDFRKLMEYHLKGIASQSRSDRSITLAFMETIRRNISRMKLADLKQAPMQLGSSLAAIIETGHREYVAGILEFFRNPRAAVALLEKSPSLSYRYQNITVELNEVARLIEKQRGLATHAILPDHYVFMALQAGDRAAILIGGWAVFRSTYNKTKDLDAAYKAFDKFVFTLQQSSLREQLAAPQTGAWRYLTMFTSAQSQYARYYYKVWGDFLKNPREPGNLERFARTMLVLHVYLPTARYWTANAFLPPAPDDDEKDKRILKWWGEMIQGPFSGLWILGHIAGFAANVIMFSEANRRGLSKDGLAVYPIEPPIYSELKKLQDNITRAFTKAMDDEGTIEDFMDESVGAGKEAAGVLGGVPGELLDALEGLYKYSEGDWIAADIPGLFYGHSVELLELMRGET